MALGKSRQRIFVHGLGNCDVRELNPNPANDYSNVGYLQDTLIEQASTTESIIDESGALVDEKVKSLSVNFQTNLMQTGIDEINLIRNSTYKHYAIRYYGNTDVNNRFQYFLIPCAKIIPSWQKKFSPEKQLIAMNVKAIDLSDELGFECPLFMEYEANQEIFIEQMKLFIAPERGYNMSTNKILDMSGFGNHGTLSSSTLWQTGTTPERFLHFNGFEDSDYLSFGDILDDDGQTDFWFELWLRVQASNGVALPIITKVLEYYNESQKGFCLFRKADNKLRFLISVDSQHYAQVDSIASITQNIWYHIAVTVDRNGYVQIYVNGSMSCIPQNVSFVGSVANNNNLKIATDDDATDFAKIDLGNFRFHRGQLPASINSIILSHYNAEKSKYGL